MDGNFSGSKKIGLAVPGNMGEDTAARCLMIGMHTFLKMNTGGIVVSYGVESKDGGIFLQSMDFKGDYAVAVRRFCEAVRIIASRNDGLERNLEAMRDKGVEILRGLEDGIEQ